MKKKALKEYIVRHECKNACYAEDDVTTDAPEKAAGEMMDQISIDEDNLGTFITVYELVPVLRYNFEVPSKAVWKKVQLKDSRKK